jgi:ABC-type nickel/cobalt efflux system permease component RcnA
MGDKIRGTIAFVVGMYALWQSYVLYQAHRTDWHLWGELAAGVVLILLGIWYFRRRVEDPAADLLK